MYFVRRSPEHLAEYLTLDDQKLNQIADKVIDRQKISYNAFKIDPKKDRYLLSKIQEFKKKQPYKVKDDPYLKREAFSPTVDRVYSTDNMLKMFKNDKYMSSNTCGTGEVLNASHTLQRLYCDRDRAYFNNQPRAHLRNRASSMACVPPAPSGARETHSGQYEEEEGPKGKGFALTSKKLSNGVQLTKPK